MDILIRNCRLIPALSQAGAPERADVLLRDGRIAKIFESGAALEALPQDAEVFEAEGRTLVPGFIDCHTHLNYDYYNGVLRLDDYTLLIDSLKSARLYPRYGVTTIRDMGAPRHVAQTVKKMIGEGLAEGPRIVTGGRILTPLSRAVPADPYCFVKNFSGVEELTRLIREEIGSGAAFVKLYAVGDPPDLLPEELETAVRLAHRAHRKVAVHAHDAEAIAMCIDCGVDTIEHATKIRKEDVHRLTGRDDIRIVPTLAILSPRVALSGSTQEAKDRMLAPLLEAGIPCLRYAYEKGLKMPMGTDVQVEHFGDNYGLELQMRIELLGVSVVDALLMATRYGAETLGIEKETGSVAEGLSADLVLLAEDPRCRAEVLWQRPEAVFVRGKLWEDPQAG